MECSEQVRVVCNQGGELGQESTEAASVCYAAVSDHKSLIFYTRKEDLTVIYVCLNDNCRPN